MHLILIDATSEDARAPTLAEHFPSEGPASTHIDVALAHHVNNGDRSGGTRAVETLDALLRSARSAAVEASTTYRQTEKG